MAKLVNWHYFEAKIRGKKIPVFSSLDIKRLFKVSKVAADFLLHRYSKKNYITRIKRGLYILPDIFLPELFIANKLYEPSYISLETALSYWGVIPETVYEVKSITPQATKRFETMGKVFSYTKIKREAFSGYKLEKQKINFAKTMKYTSLFNNPRLFAIITRTLK